MLAALVTLATWAAAAAHQVVLPRAPPAAEALPRKRALALMGGRWLAQFAEMGVLVALGAATAPNEPVLSLLEGFDTISCVSGGSWLATSMIYSPRYAAWMEELKGAPIDEVPAVFRTWIDNYHQELPLCSVAEAAAYMAKVAAKNVQLGLPVGAAMPHPKYPTKADQQACSYFDKDLRAAVPAMLAATAELRRNATLGGTRSTWATGKQLLVPVSIPMRTDADTAYDPKSAHNFLLWNGSRGSGIQYQPLGEHPQYMPAKISWTIGGAADQEAPEPFCVGCAGLRYAYTGADEAREEVELAATLEEAYRASAGQLEIALVAAAGSAADGRFEVAHGTTQSLLRRTGQAALYAAVSPSASVLAGGTLKDELAALAGPAAVRLAAEHRLHALVDGGDTDQTGIIQAVAAGADFVVSLQLAASRGGLPQLDLFTREGRLGIGPVFDASDVDILAAFNNTEHWLSPPASTGEEEPSGLRKLVVFEQNLTTVDNPWFGISRGRVVRVLFIFVSVDPRVVALGPPANTFEQYGLLVRDLVQLLRSHRKVAQSLARRFLL